MKVTGVPIIPKSKPSAQFVFVFVIVFIVVLKRIERYPLS